MPCRKSSMSKYKRRPGPPYPAQDCRGQRKLGNNKHYYTSVADKNGVYHWKKASVAKKKKSPTKKGRKSPKKKSRRSKKMKR